MSRARKRAYSPIAMSYAKEVIANYDTNRARLDDLLENAAYTNMRKSTVGQDLIPTAPSGGQPSNPTLKSVLSLEDPETAQLSLQVRAVEHTINQLNPEHFDLFVRIFRESYAPQTGYERNVRDFILQLVCAKLGMPERS